MKYIHRTVGNGHEIYSQDRVQTDIKYIHRTAGNGHEIHSQDSG